MYALREEKVAVATALAQAGADVNLPDSTGRTPLIQACRINSQAVVEVLLQAGADPTIKDPQVRLSPSKKK